MTNLLVLKEQLKNFYSKNDAFIIPGLKFLMAFVALLLINGQLGYMSRINSPAIALIAALTCSFLPINLIILIAALFVLLHLYALSIECAIVGLAVFLILFLLYFRFSPKDTAVIILTPLCFALNIPYVIPISMGLIGTPFSTVSVSCGVVVYYLISYVNGNAAALNAMEEESVIQKFRFIIDGMLNNKAMIVAIIAFVIAIVIVYFIRRMSIDHSWTIAIVTGALASLVIVFVGDMVYATQISIIGTFLGCLVSIGIVWVLQFFVFNVDYSRTEHVQFEDDEYYYYVKAVPKITVATPDKKVKKINIQKKPALKQTSVNKK